MACKRCQDRGHTFDPKGEKRCCTCITPQGKSTGSTTMPYYKFLEANNG